MSESRVFKSLVFLFLTIASIGFIALTLNFLAKKVESLENVPFYLPGGSTTNAVPMPVSYSKLNGKFLFRTEFSSNFSQIPHQIIIKLATGQAEPKVLSSIIMDTDGNCIWKSPPNASLKDNSYITWNLEKCSKTQVTSLTLLIETNEPFTLYIWTRDISNAGLSEKNLLKLKNAPNALMGSFTIKTDKPSKTRLQLLSYLWDQETETLVTTFVCVGLLLFVIGIFTFYYQKIHSRNFALIFIWLGSTLLYTIVCPPFHAPDEPDHLLAYSAISNDLQLSEKFLTLAQKDHFERIKFHPEEKFSPNDLGNPLNTPWAEHIHATDMSQRSIVTQYLWKALNQLPSPDKPAHQILRLRIFNSLFVLLFALIFGGQLLKIQLQEERNFSLIIFLIPTLIFFSMHISNYFSAIAIYLASSFIFCRMLLIREISKRDLFSLGICIALAPYTVRSGSGTLVVWAIILSVAMFTEEINSQYTKEKMYDFLIFSMPIILGQLFFNKTLFDISRVALDFLSIKETLKLMSSMEPGAASSYTLLFPLLFLIRGGICRIEENWAKKLLLAAKLVIVLSSITSLFFYLTQFLYPPLSLTTPDIEIYAVSNPSGYATETMISFWTNLFPGPIDFYLSASFWSGFGWLEFNLQAWLINLIRTLTGVTFAIGLFKLVWRGSLWHSLRGTAIFLSINIMLWGLSFKLAQISVNIHGRYLIFLYLLTSVLSSYGILAMKEFINERKKLSPKIIDALFCILILGIHTFAILLIIDRYFA